MGRGHKIKAVLAKECGTCATQAGKLQRISAPSQDRKKRLFLSVKKRGVM